MCGIVGGFDRERRPFGAECAEAACRRIAHRGPDDQGYFESDGMLVGNRRLSILGLADGHQPMFSDDEQIVVVQNGEIYNFVELAKGLNCRTNCDTEVILRLYERDGEAFVHQLNGMFAIAIIDRRKQQLLLFRDRIGQKPLYLHDDGKRLLFASEIKSLFAMGITPEVNWRGLDEFLTYNYVPPPGTMFKGIRHLSPGHMLRIGHDGLQESAWWDLSDVGQQEDVSDWSDEVLETLRESVRVRLRSDVPLGAFLSGGLDSSLIVKLMSDQMHSPVKTFCIGIEDAWFKDAEFAAEAAAYCGAEHRCEMVHSDLAAAWPLTVYHNDQPHGDISFLPTYLVSKLASEQLKVVLTGDGGDELFGGYDRYASVMRSVGANSDQAAFEKACVGSLCLFNEQQRQSLMGSHAKRQIGGYDPLDSARAQLSELRHFDRVNQMLGLDLKMLMPGNNLIKPDKMAMAVSLEARSPFMDYRLVDLAFRIPGRFKLQGGQGKAVFKKAAEKVLPKSIIYREKQMFTMPVGRWFRGVLQPFVKEVLLSPNSLCREVFIPQQVQRIVDEHVAGRHDWTRQLRALVTFELWHRIFMDCKSETAPSYEDLGITSFPKSFGNVSRAA